FFFFQAEDGIRDFHVTGVQTCALPIYSGAIPFASKGGNDSGALRAFAQAGVRAAGCADCLGIWNSELRSGNNEWTLGSAGNAPQIGRASCRDRLQHLAVNQLFSTQMPW